MGRAIAENYSYAEISRTYDIDQTVARPLSKTTTCLLRIAQKVDKASKSEMSLIYDKLKSTTDKVLEKADIAPVQYASQYYRTGMVGLSTEVDIHVQTEKLRF